LYSLLCAYFSASVIAPALLYLLHPCSRYSQQKTTQYKNRKLNRAEYRLTCSRCLLIRFSFTCFFCSLVFIILTIIK